MFKIKFKSEFMAFFFMAFVLAIFASWIVNFIQLCFSLINPVLWSGDFSQIGRAAVHLIGLFPPASLVTVWF